MALETGEKGAATALKEPAAGERMIALTSSEAQEFRVTEAEARLSSRSRLAGMIIGNGDNVVALCNVPARALDTATKYCNKHKHTAAAVSANPSPRSSPRAVARERMITLTSSEGQEFLVTEAGARLSSHLAGMIIGNGDNVVALRNVPARRALYMATKYCNNHTAAAASPSPSAVAGERMITLTSSEGQEFLVTEAGARLSSHLAGMIGNGNNVVALRNVPARALDTVTKYCNKHAAAAAINPNPSAAAGSSSFNAAPYVDQELDEWDGELVRGLDDVDALYDLLIAANFLRLDGLIDIVCEKVADMIKCCETPKKIRETFRLPDDLTAEEKEAIRMEYSWAFDADDI